MFVTCCYEKKLLNFFVSKLVGLHIFAAAYTAGAAVDHMQGLRGSFKISKIMTRSLRKIFEGLEDPQEPWSRSIYHGITC